MFAFLYHAAPATRGCETGKNRIGPPPQPSLPAIRAAIVADDVPSGQELARAARGQSTKLVLGSSLGVRSRSIMGTRVASADREQLWSRYHRSRRTRGD